METTTRDELTAMTVKDLRATLKDLGEKTGGKKAELVTRLWKRVGGREPPGEGERQTPTRAELEEARQRRLELEALHGTLARKRCRNCATMGAWEVYDLERNQKRTRYIKCRGCGAADQVPVIVKENVDATRRN